MGSRLFGFEDLELWLYHCPVSVLLCQDLLDFTDLLFLLDLVDLEALASPDAFVLLPWTWYGGRDEGFFDDGRGVGRLVGVPGTFAALGDGVGASHVCGRAGSKFSWG